MTPRGPRTETLPRVPPQVFAPPAEPGLYVNEVFTSIQGEGRSIGRPTVFLRTMGCHLRCVWCDTTYSFHEGAWRSLASLRAELDATGLRRLCLTGGEPLLQRDAWPLVRALLQDGWDVTIETSGSIECEEADRIAAELGADARARLCLSIDVKCPGSGVTPAWNPRNFAYLTEHDQLKFVLADMDDYAFGRDWLHRHTPLPCPVYLHPVGGTDGPLLTRIAEGILADRLDVRLGVQLHKLVWGDQRGV